MNFLYLRNVLKLFSILIAVISIKPVYGAFDYPAYSARNAALSNSYLASTRIWDGFITNPALSANVPSLYAALNYSQLFSLKDLQYANGIAVMPLKSFGVGIGIENFGNSLYTENKILINASKLFYNNVLSIGFSLNIYHISAERYGSSNSLGLTLGVQYRVLSNLYLAGVIENINQPTINGFGEEIPQRIQAGLQFAPVGELRAHLKVQKDSYFAPEVFLGVEYQLFDNFELYSGYSTIVTTPSFGVSLNVAKVEASYAMQYHFDLGATHFVGIAFNAGR